jgi:hypothetical protein
MSLCLGANQSSSSLWPSFSFRINDYWSLRTVPAPGVALGGLDFGTPYLVPGAWCLDGI